MELLLVEMFTLDEETFTELDEGTSTELDKEVFTELELILAEGLLDNGGSSISGEEQERNITAQSTVAMVGNKENLAILNKIEK